MMVVVYSTGSVLWVPKVKRKAVCSLQGSGVYDCQFKFGSWTMHGAMLMPDFYGDVKSFDLSDYMERNEYEIISNNATRDLKKYPCCEDIYPTLKFTISAKRKEGFTNSVAKPCVHAILAIMCFCAVFFKVY